LSLTLNATLGTKLEQAVVISSFHQIQNMKKFILPSFLLLFLLLFFQNLNAQRTLTEHTLTSEKSLAPPKAKITDLSWLVGRWTGSGLGGQLEENWNPPLGSAMLGTFQLLENGNPKFYEICLIAEENNSLIYKVKHFNPDLTGWEEKDEYVSFRL